MSLSTNKVLVKSFVKEVFNNHNNHNLSALKNIWHDKGEKDSSNY
jgi:hypothetical protein